MRILLILIFILISNNSFAGKKERKAYEEYLKNFKKQQLADKHKGGNYICKGFCKGEKYDYRLWAVKNKIDVVIKGKKKKLDIMNVYKGFDVKNSECSPFIGWVESFPDKVEKSMTTLHAHFEIDVCIPCPPGMGIKNNLSGFCPHPMYQLDLSYKKAVDIGYSPPKLGMLFTHYEIGREKTNSQSFHVNHLQKGLFIESLTLSISPKEDLNIWRLINKDPDSKEFYDGKEYLYRHIKYKTPWKLEEIKVSEWGQLYLDTYQEDSKIKSVIDDLIFRIQNAYGTVFRNEDKNYKKISVMYDMIPTDEEIDILKDTFSELEGFHIQSRN